MRYEVIESKRLVHPDGRTASIYGAKPHGEGWEIVTTGWMVRNPHTGQIGIGRQRWATREEAEAFAAKLSPSRIGIGD
jgi:hypothetical protein